MTDARTNDLLMLLFGIRKEIARLEESIPMFERFVEMLQRDIEALTEEMTANSDTDDFEDKLEMLSDQHYSKTVDLRRSLMELRSLKTLLVSARSRFQRVYKLYQERTAPTDQALIRLMNQRENEKQGK